MARYGSGGSYYANRSSLSAKSSRKRGVYKSAMPYSKNPSRSDWSSPKFDEAVKRVLLKTTEPKKHSYALGKVDIKHNLPYTFLHLNNPVTMPAQGTGDNERVGDQIITSGFTLKLVFGQFADRENVTWQLRVVSVPKGSGYTYNQWYDNVTNNVMLDDMNEDFVTVQKTYTFKTAQGAQKKYDSLDRADMYQETDVVNYDVRLASK